VSGTISPDLERFVVEYLPSIGHLEAMLHLHRDRAQWWTAEGLARVLGVSEPAANQILEELCSANLLAVRVGSALAYQYAPGSRELETVASELVEALRFARPRIYTLITSRSTQALRQFADAFRLRGRDRG
jgi:hypothetical protein